MFVSFELNNLARLRAKEVMTLIGVKKSVFYKGIGSGRYPKPDGIDGRMPFWKTETVRAFLAGGK